MEEQKTHVVVTRIGDYWVTQDEARKVAQSLSKSKFITLEGSMIGIYSIDGILTAEQYKLNASQRKKSWRCKYGSVHQAGEICSCGVKLNAPAPPRELDISDEQKQLNAARGRAASEYIRANLGKNPAALKDSKKREAFIARRVVEILAEGSQDHAGEPADAKSDENATDKKDTQGAPQNGSN